MLEKVHEIGMVYNDLKLDNIMVGDLNSSPESLCQIKLIDFGLATAYIDVKNKHIKQEVADYVGNLAFCSNNAMNYMSLSRRDDLISLCYLLVYILQGRLEFLDIDEKSKVP